MDIKTKGAQLTSFPPQKIITITKGDVINKIGIYLHKMHTLLSQSKQKN